MILHIDRERNIYAVNGDFLPGIALADAKPGISAESAIEVAKAKTGGTVYRWETELEEMLPQGKTWRPEAELMIYQRNGESYLIGRTVGKAGKEIVVSFAEIQQGHVGIVYQATNWIYTGLSAKRTNWTIVGVSKHCQTLADKYISDEIRAKFGDRFSLQDRPRKHRYVFINAKGRRKLELIAQLKYPQLPYPKNAIQNNKWQSVKTNCKAFLDSLPLDGSHEVVVRKYKSSRSLDQNAAM